MSPYRESPTKQENVQKQFFYPRWIKEFWWHCKNKAKQLKHKLPTLEQVLHTFGFLVLSGSFVVVFVTCLKPILAPLFVIEALHWVRVKSVSDGILVRGNGNGERCVPVMIEQPIPFNDIETCMCSCEKVDK